MGAWLHFLHKDSMPSNLCLNEMQLGGGFQGHHLRTLHDINQCWHYSRQHFDLVPLVSCSSTVSSDKFAPMWPSPSAHSLAISESSLLCSCSSELLLLCHFLDLQSRLPHPDPLCLMLPLAASNSFGSPCVVFVPTKQISKIQVTDLTIMPIATSIA